jgi:hypothetical protein
VIRLSQKTPEYPVFVSKNMIDARDIDIHTGCGWIIDNKKARGTSSGIDVWVIRSLDL